MKRSVSFILAVLLLTATLALPVSADITEDKRCYVFWLFGTVDEYVLDVQKYEVGQIPAVPDVTPTKEDPTRLFHFVRWDKAPEPVNDKEDHYFYYAMYRVYEKKYAMNFDTQVTIADVAVLLDVLSGEDVETLSNTDVSGFDARLGKDPSAGRKRTKKLKMERGKKPLSFFKAGVA